MPVANMLAAAVRAGAFAGERGAQDQPATQGPAGVDLPPSVDRRPGPGPHRVDHAPVRAGRRCGRSRLGPLSGHGPRRRPRTVRTQHPGPARLRGACRQGLPGRGGTAVRARGVPAVPELGRFPAPVGVLPGDRHAHRRRRRRLRSTRLQRPAAPRLQGHDVRGGAAHLGPTHARSKEGGGPPRRAAPVAAGRLRVRPRRPGGPRSRRGGAGRCRRPVPRVRGDRHLLRRGEGVPRAAVPQPRSGLDRGGQLDAAPPEPGAGDPAQPDLRRRLRLGPLQVRAQHRR